MLAVLEAEPVVDCREAMEARFRMFGVEGTRARERDCAGWAVVTGEFGIVAEERSRLMDERRERFNAAGGPARVEDDALLMDRVAMERERASVDGVVPRAWREDSRLSGGPDGVRRWECILSWAWGGEKRSVPAEGGR